jgi:predicted helicase
MVKQNRNVMSFVDVLAHPCILRRRAARNRPAEIDELIKASYIQHSKAQKSKVYDMYSRFFRWATNRLDKDGIVAYITNSSFLHTGTFDGFRKIVADEFNHIYIVDLGGNIRAGDKSGNVFGIKLGVAISFMIKKQDKKQSQSCKIYYSDLSHLKTVEEKLNFLSETNFSEITFSHLQPDSSNNWINEGDNNFSSLISICTKESKNESNSDLEKVFEIYSNGLSTNRDEWVYDFECQNLENKIIFFLNEYNAEVDRWKVYLENRRVKVKNESDPILEKFLCERNLIKWSSRLKRDKLLKGKNGQFNNQNIVRALYRPFFKQLLYFDYIPIDLFGKQNELFHVSNRENLLICLTSPGSEKPFMVIASQEVPDLHLVGAGCGALCFSLYRYDENGNRIDNITDWSLTQFQNHYNDPTITKENIFHYTYTVLHHPAYRTKYELNLKREFPRLPFYADFHQWATWGKELMDLHLNYETIEPYGLRRVDVGRKKSASDTPLQATLIPIHTPDPAKPIKRTTPKAKLKADKTEGKIILDTETTLEGIPAVAWDYKLGNRSALEWILDQYKEKTPKDPTIAKLFNTYKFADYKEHVIDLLQRVCTVSVRTMEVIQQMPDTVEHQGG